MTDDMELVREYATTRSEHAFEKLVARHLNMVHSAALRRAGDPQLAQEITQAVFIVLARKAERLRPKTVLAGWLYRTTRYVAADALKTQLRRQVREHEAYMQSTLNEPEVAAWNQLAPLLDGAMDSLSEADRNAIVLRFFEGKSLAEVGVTMGTREGAAKKRVSRALERLRTFFSKRGVTLPSVLIAGAVSANAVQAVPAGLAATVAAAASNSSTLAVSTLALAKGAVKLMAWAKAKMTIVAAGLTLVGGAAAVLVHSAVSNSDKSNRYVLDDGSVLVLNRVLVGSQIRIAHGKPISKILGPVIPSNGIHLLSLNLDRRTEHTFDSKGKSWMVAEFSINGPNAAKHPLVTPAFFRQFRFVLYGDSGVEFVQELWGDTFRSYPDGYFGYIVANRFPRDSHWLGFRVERRETEGKGGPWQKVADFRHKNPDRARLEAWTASTGPVTNSSRNFDFILEGVTVQTIPFMARDIWNHVVTAPMHALSNGVLMTNWSVPYGNVQAEDASGNWDSLASHRSLDPKYVWKVEADFEPQSNFSKESLATIQLPHGSGTVITNVMNIPVTLSWDGSWIDASIPTNHPNVALRFVDATEDDGQNVYQASGNWSKHRFHKGSFMTEKAGVLTMVFKPTKVTIVVVPTLHTTFYVQPRSVK